MKRFKKIVASSESEDTRIKDLSSDLKDDFDYILDGIDMLDRNGRINEGIDVCTAISDSLQTYVRQIADILQDNI